MNHFPSSLSRDQASGAEIVSRKDPSQAQVAMMNASEYESYMRRRGEWGGTAEQREAASYERQTIFQRQIAEERTAKLITEQKSITGGNEDGRKR